MSNCLLCSKYIPKARKKTARYCSEECYYEAKKERSIKRYNSVITNFAEIKANESILHRLYILIQLKKPLFFHDLDGLGFNWGLSDKEIAGKDDTIWKVVGKYAYYISPDTKQISIWKMP